MPHNALWLPPGFALAWLCSTGLATCMPCTAHALERGAGLEVKSGRALAVRVATLLRLSSSTALLLIIQGFLPFEVELLLGENFAEIGTYTLLIDANEAGFELVEVIHALPVQLAALVHPQATHLLVLLHAQVALQLVLVAQQVVHVEVGQGRR